MNESKGSALVQATDSFQHYTLTQLVIICLAFHKRYQLQATMTIDILEPNTFLCTRAWEAATMFICDGGPNDKTLRSFGDFDHFE
jgi:hypothetical protein